MKAFFKNSDSKTYRCLLNVPQLRVGEWKQQGDRKLIRVRASELSSSDRAYLRKHLGYILSK